MKKPLLLTMAFGLIGLVGCTAFEESATSEAVNIDKFDAYTRQHADAITLTQNHATGHVGDWFFTHWKDGGSASLDLDPDGSFSVSWEGGGYNYVGGPGWHYGDKDRVIGYRFDEDSGANFITLYGWGYDKALPTSDPAHLVEYYILQRYTYNPGQHGVVGKTFVSDGVEYTSYRTVREQKPSINSTSTFYQYWSIPTEQRELGKDYRIVFADHVKAWEETGWVLPDMNNFDASDDPTYQVMAVEVFNPAADGTASGKMWNVKEP